jgi:SAM-dependent methyltransferase
MDAIEPHDGAGTSFFTLEVRPAGMLVAAIGFARPLHAPPRITVHVDGIQWATLPTLFVGSGRDEVTLRCGLPPHLARCEADILLENAGTGAPIGRGRIRIGDAAANPHGLSAREVYDPAIAPMFSVPWMHFDGADLVVSGAHLPPFGDPGRLSVAFAEGIVAAFDYPLPSPEFGAHYWYWPNAHHAGFQLRITLPASRFGTDPFSFRFDVAGDREACGAGTGWPDRARIWLPTDLRDFIGFPVDGDQLTRVQTWSDQKTVTLTGYAAFRGFESLLARHGVIYRPGLRLLDWGCGHGRVTRHFQRHWPAARVTGIDIDSSNIAWCQATMDRDAYVHAPLWPPTCLASRSFDAILGLSVMTHLSAEAQQAWLKEIHRLLKPGGVALISFGGDGAAAFASIHHTPAWWRQWRQTGFDDDLMDPSLGNTIADQGYYRVTHQSADHVRAYWGERLTVEAIEPQAFGYQDIAVLRRDA